ncbi:hypothetical protein ACWOB6_04450 [Falseniella ignava]
MGRMIAIGSLVFLGLAFLGIGLGMYFFLKRLVVNGKSVLDEPVNEQTRTDKMGLGELLVYLSMIVIAGVFVVQIMSRGGTGNAILARIVILPPILALFNARKRTGKAMIALLVSFMMALFLMIAYGQIGFPPKAPELMIDDKQLTLTQTSVNDLLKEGFDIYIREEDSSGNDYEANISSRKIKKYQADKSVFIKKGFRRDSNAVSHAPYLLGKDGLVLGSIALYGDDTKETALEDCKIIQFKLDEDRIKAAKSKAISYKLDGVDLLARFEEGNMRTTFGDKLWSVPPAHPLDSTQLWYGIQWKSPSDHLFWNEYFSLIRLDENYHMIDFELVGEVARDDW